MTSITALVTGASQGVGKGITEGLAEAGHRVYCTARNMAALAEAAAQATALGGHAIARQVDHRDDAQVHALFDELKSAPNFELLVNSVWGGYETMVENGQFTWADPFWQQPAWRWPAMMDVGVRAAFVAAQHAAPLMIARRRGLIVNLSFWAAQKHAGNALYGMAKAATDKMTADMDAELATHGVRVISLYPGLVRTERVMQNASAFDLSNSESPRFSGRVIAALLSRPDYVATIAGKVCVGAQAALDLGVVDIDGTRPRPLTLNEA